MFTKSDFVSLWNLSFAEVEELIRECQAIAREREKELRKARHR